MKKCEKCNVSVDTNKKQCPLCFSELDGEYEQTMPLYSDTTYTDNTHKKNRLLMKIFVFITIAAIAICTFVNVLTGLNVFWSALVDVGLLYVWILVRHTIISRRGAFEKIFFQFGAIFALVLTTNWISGGEWFWNIFVPSASLLTTTGLLFLLLINKKRSDFALSSFVMSILLVGLSIVLVCLPVDNFKLLNWINIIYTGLFLIAILLFGGKTLKRSLQKNLHV